MASFALVHSSPHWRDPIRCWRTAWVDVRQSHHSCYLAWGHVSSPIRKVNKRPPVGSTVEQSISCLRRHECRRSRHLSLNPLQIPASSRSLYQIQASERACFPIVIGSSNSYLSISSIRVQLLPCSLLLTCMKLASFCDRSFLCSMDLLHVVIAPQPSQIGCLEICISIQVIY